jgi:integrase
VTDARVIYLPESSSETSPRTTFHDFLLAQGLAERTVAIYRNLIDQAVLWFVDRDSDLAEASAVDLVAWASELSPSRSRRRQARFAIQHYLVWLGKNTAIAKAVRVPPKPRYFCQAVSLEEAGNLNRVALKKGFPRGTAVLLGFYLALRVHEIAGARWDGFDAGMSRYTLTGKGSYTATLPVHETLRQHLEPLPTRYLFLFPGERSPHVTRKRSGNGSRTWAARPGIEDLRTHQLRHTAIATLHDATGDLRTAAEFARHRRVETTMIYSRTPEATLRKAVDSISY